jgi:hypothetical protein
MMVPGLLIHQIRDWWRTEIFFQQSAGLSDIQAHISGIWFQHVGWWQGVVSDETILAII